MSYFTRNPRRNSCGECTACCTAIGVTELDKPERTPCQHECQGCAIYPDRPQSCRDYECIWLTGLMGNHEAARPDKLGIIFSGTNDDNMIQVDELHESAADEERCKCIIGKIAEDLMVVIKPFDVTRNRKLIGPRHLIETKLIAINKRLQNEDM